MTLRDPNNIRLPRYMVVQLRFDRESFDALRELLQESVRLTTKGPYNPYNRAAEESPADRRTREALRRVFDQIRDVTYSDV